jgi:hypothetical protein
MDVSGGGLDFSAFGSGFCRSSSPVEAGIGTYSSDNPAVPGYL